MKEFIKIEWYPSDRPNDTRVIIDRPIYQILPNSVFHKILNFIRNEMLYDKLRSDRNLNKPILTPANISSALNMKHRRSLLYPALEKLWLANLINKEWEWVEQAWWWTKYGPNQRMLEALEILDQKRIFKL